MKHAITTEHIYDAYIQRRAIKTRRNSLDIWQRAFGGHTTVKIETNKASLSASTCIDARRTPTVHLSESIAGTFGCNKRSQSNLERNRVAYTSHYAIRFPPKLPPARGGSSGHPASNTPFRGPTRSATPNGSSIASTVFAQYTVVTNGRTEKTQFVPRGSHSTTPTRTPTPTSSRGSSRECRRVVQLATGITSIARVGHVGEEVGVGVVECELYAISFRATRPNNSVVVAAATR